MSPPELGDRVSGAVIDGALWNRESRIRRVRPARHAAGEVHGIYPQAPRVAAVLTRDGELVHVLVGSVRR